MNTNELNMKLSFVNDHREALGYEPFTIMTESEIQAQLALIEEHAPYGDDPWAK